MTNTVLCLEFFFKWLQAFCIFSSVLGEKHLEKCTGLFQHMEHVLEAYNNFGGMGWFCYDESPFTLILNGEIRM